MRFEKTPCRMKWCYSELRHDDGTCDKNCEYNTKIIYSNYDTITQIASMDKLAVFLAEIANCDECRAKQYGCTDEEGGCWHAWYVWLKQDEKDIL